MDKLVCLNHKEFNLLEEVLDYLLCDDKELIDFKLQLKINGYNSLLEILFHERYDQVLQIDLVPKELRSHVYYKTQVLLQGLREIQYGS